MKVFNVCLLLCSILVLPGCFDNSDNKTKANNDGSQSSVQMQNKDGDSK
ncbi:hypothetical protein ABQX22_00730 [Xanthomonas sp. WHRI 1810A]|jgi:hypothetical protein